MKDNKTLRIIHAVLLFLCSSMGLLASLVDFGERWLLKIIYVVVLGAAVFGLVYTTSFLLRQNADSTKEKTDDSERK